MLFFLVVISKNFKSKDKNIVILLLFCCLLLTIQNKIPCTGGHSLKINTTNKNDYFMNIQNFHTVVPFVLSGVLNRRTLSACSLRPCCG